MKTLQKVPDPRCRDRNHTTAPPCPARHHTTIGQSTDNTGEDGQAGRHHDREKQSTSTSHKKQTVSTATISLFTALRLRHLSPRLEQHPYHSQTL
ncbi:hypothetical protein LY76DRAFT_324076 [Colletotrichum caudatum]|nr:hypothetical protein LY76DRAFT_324076 [Colletotrichum caudatum]